MIITLQTLIFFRESLFNALDRMLRPYYKKFSLAFYRNGEVSDDEESDEQVFAEFDDERGVVFYPPMYLQRYAAVSDCLMDEQWCGKLEKVVDLGYHDMSFIKYLKEVQGIKCILGVDLESIPLRCSMDLVGCDDYIPKRENPLEVTLFKGNAADPDYRLIGCDAVIAIEMIEHMLPHDLDRLIHTVFGFIKPLIAIFTTPNGDFNVLFKALEKNGLRRLDHFFEWSQEQFHDWCSNIILRYPQYTVSRKGIGPGPDGTKHLGCCSQMALFVAKEYNKQQDLNLNSLALVSDTPSPDSMNNLISSWENTALPNESNMIEPPKNIESNSEIHSELHSEKQSCITIVLTSPSFSLETITYQDKTSQCNLDTEFGKSYLMFDYDQMCFDVVIPRRNVNNRVYDIEDVYSRLNCTTLQVKKFSKITQNLMAKNKVDTLVHTREVVDEIRHLTRMLNFKKECHNELENGTHTWCNINWGENAPYWNQYYKVVKEYNYPFEVKSEECRILDLISDEINRLIDAQFDEEFSLEMNKLEIPIEHLMNVVAHITDDVEKVKDLLEWNGYEVVCNMVIHSRLVVDYSPLGTQEDDSQDTDMCSDWDSTEFRSTSVSDGSTIVPDYHARCLRRALDQKVRKLRSMLTADEDITTELDRVVCRLMKLALRTSRGRNTPPPTKWMQCKLLDLLTLTEKAIERRRRYFIESYPLKAINYEEKSEEMMALEKIKEDNTALIIVDKYKHLVNETGGMAMEHAQADYRFVDFGLEDDLSISSTEFAKDYEFVDRPSLLAPGDTLPDTQLFHPENITHQGESKLKRTQAWVEEDIEVVPYPNHDATFDNSSVETDHNTTKLTKYYKKRYKGKQCIELNCVICKKSHSKAFKQNRIEERNRANASKTKLVKKVSSRKKSSNNSLGLQTNNKFVSVDYKTYRVKPRRKQHKAMYPTASKPIPANLIELCQSESMVGNDMGYDNTTVDIKTKVDKDIGLHELKTEVAATKHSLLMDIVTDDVRETLALRRTIGTDADGDSMALEDETLIRSVSNTFINDDYLYDKHNVATENVHSQTIFLYDINEPTTSKGIRHFGMDVQCGPDAIAPTYSMLSATTSLTRMSKMFTAGIKIGDSTTDIKIKNTDCGTCTYDAYPYKTIVARPGSVGIKIKDSDSNVIKQMNCLTVPTYSVISATTSLTRMPMMFKAGIQIEESTTDDKMNSTDCGTCNKKIEHFDKTILPRQRSVGIKIQNSDSNLPKQMECSTNTQHSFDNSNDSLLQKCSKETMLLKFVPRERSVGIKFKDFDQYLFDNVECSTNTQQADNESNVSSRKPHFKTTSLIESISNDSSVSNKNIDFGSNPSQQIEYPANTQQQEFCDKLDASSQPASHEITLLKSKRKEKSVGFVIKDSALNLPQQMESPTYTQEFYDHTDNISNASSPLPLLEETTLLRSPSLLKIEDSTSEFCVSVGSCAKSDLQVISAVNKVVGGPGRSCRYVKPKLCNGGVQVHSYRDKQTLSEDIMYQGEWQRSKPKVLTKRKCYNTLSRKIIDSNLKKKTNSKERIQIKNLGYSKERVLSKNLVTFSKDKNPSNNLVKIDVKPVLRKSLLPRNTLHANLKQEMNKMEFKRNQKLPATVDVAKSMKPFRNILKVPSKFPMSSVPTKNPKSALNLKTPPKISNLTVTKDDKTPQKNTKLLKKNYIPLYLRQRLKSANDISKNDLNLSFDSAQSKLKTSREKASKTLVRSKTEEIKRDLLKFQAKPTNLQYVVLRNDIEKKKSDNDGKRTKNTSDSAKKKDVASRQRSVSPNSANSSTCSSPCSIATVRAVSARPKTVTNRRQSASSYINNTVNSESENTSPDRNRKFSKRCKSAKITAEKVSDNKENIPQTSKQVNIGKKESAKFGKASFGKNKDVYIAHIKETSPLQSTVNTLSKNRAQKSNINVPKADSVSEKRSSPRRSPSLSKRESLNFNASLTTTHKNEVSESAQTSNMVLVIEPQAREIHSSTDIPKVDTSSVANRRSVTNWIDNSNKDAADSHTGNISTMKKLIDETLDFIDDPYDNTCIDSETVILSRANLNPRDPSPTSFKTIITNDNYNDILHSDIEYAVNRSFDTTFGDESILSLNDTRLTVTDFDVLSYKSITSASKYSGYLSADNELSSSNKLPIPAPNSTSVREIFERKEQLFQPAQNTPGAIANLAFSGFSIDGDTVPGDQPDLVNLIDSETGSLAVGVTRQATSEELFVSGRSSDSFQSCLLDEDAVVPNWLFQIISQQQSAMDELEAPAELMDPMPVAEPMFDDNGNPVEPPGVGAGAGDGRGMHSDQSQDSSGRGTSVSSSDTSSSGPQSEAILIDPSAFVAQFEMLRDAVESSVMVLATNEPEAIENAMSSRQGPVEIDSRSFSRGESRRTPRVLPVTASDVDADVSSLDTDVPDLSDN